VVICLKRGADLHTAQLMPLLLTVSCFSKIQIGITFLVPAYPGSPGQRAVKRVCVCLGHHPDHVLPGTTVTVRCNMTSESWSLTCLSNNSWTVPPPSTVHCPSTHAASFSMHTASYTVAPPEGGRGEATPLWVDVQKLCNMCVLSLSWNFFVSHDKYFAIEL